VLFERTMHNQVMFYSYNVIEALWPCIFN